MKNLVKILLVVSVLSYGNIALGQTATPTSAPSTQPTVAAKITPDQRAERRAADLKTRLGLSDEQTAKVKKIILDNENQRNADMKTAGQDKDARVAAMKKNREQLDNDLAKVFTADQLAKYKASQQRPSANAPAGIFLQPEHRNNFF